MIKNLTPHVIRLQRPDGETIEIQPSGQVARVAVEEREVGQLSGFPLVLRRFGRVENLPEPDGDTIFVVSAVVLEAVKASGGRADVVAPDTGATAVRDANGQIVAVRRLIIALEV